MYLLWNGGGTCGQPQPVAISHGHAKLHNGTPGLNSNQTWNRKCNPVWLLKHEDLSMLSLAVMIPPNPVLQARSSKPSVGLVHGKITSWLRPPSVDDEEMLSVIWLFLLHLNWDEDRIPMRRQSRTLNIARLVAHVTMYWLLLSVERNQMRRWAVPGGSSLERCPLCRASLVNSVIFKHKETLLRLTNLLCVFYKATKHTEEGGLT